MRKDVLNPSGYKMFDAVDISTNQTSEIVYIPFLDNPGIIVEWTGTSPVGELVLEVSNQKENPNEAMIWTSLYSSTIAVTGNTGIHTLTATQLPYNAMRLKYLSTSGTGTLTAILQVKMV